MLNRPVVVALAARKANGKSTVANYLAERFGAERVMFAAGVKELAGRLLPWRREQMFGTQAEKETVDPRFGLSCREFMQRVGNEAREVIGPNVWVDAALTTIRSGGPRLVVIDDLRYVSEARAIAIPPELSFRGVVIKLVRSDLPNDDPHPSEAQVDMIPSDLIAAAIEHGGPCGACEHCDLGRPDACLDPRGVDYLLERIDSVLMDLAGRDWEVAEALAADPVFASMARRG